MQRLNQLRGNFRAAGIDGLLVASPVNRLYLSGFTGSTGWLVISVDRAVLAVDFRYVEQAKQESPFDVVHVIGDMSSWLPGIAADLGIRRLGVEKDHMMLTTYESLRGTLQKGRPETVPVAVKDLVESLRVVKSAEEIDSITRAAAIADRTMAYIGSHLRPGVSEIQFAWELEKFIRGLKYEPLPFEIIVASGPNSALPHARPTERLIGEGEPITIDLGARYGGYCCDMTRTFCIGRGDAEFYKVYNVVLGSQLGALSVIGAGIKAADADKVARSMIEEAGYGPNFGHGLGHGVGLETHEAPRLGMSSDDILLENMVFTVEPGVYIPGWGGVRIEDTVTINNGKLKTITTATKEAHIHGG